MNFTFNNSSIVSVNSGTIVLNVSGKTRTFVEAKLVSAVDGEIVLDLPEASFKKGSYTTGVSTKNGGKVTFILSQNTDIKIYYHVSTRFTGLTYNDYWFKRDSNFRNATPEEIQELNDQLEAVGKCWNPDTMQIEKLRWKPSYKDLYYCINIFSSIVIINHVWNGDIIDYNYYNTNNCFKTKEEAEAKLEEIKKLLA